MFQSLCETVQTAHPAAFHHGTVCVVTVVDKPHWAVSSQDDPRPIIIPTLLRTLQPSVGPMWGHSAKTYILTRLLKY